MRVSDFDYELPKDLIAQTPPAERGTSRLLILERATGRVTHGHIQDLPAWLRRGDLLVVNDTKVFPARLVGRRVPSGGRIECLLLDRHPGDRWDALVHPGQKLKVGARFVCGDADQSAGEKPMRQIWGEIEGRDSFGRRTVRLWTESGRDVDAVVDEIGHMPLPPYIARPDGPLDIDRYQTVYARARGSVAAPTAGLHLTPALLDRLAQDGVERTSVTLHVGYGTFKPVRVEDVEAHTVDVERFDVPPDAAARMASARAAGSRIVAVGTTTVRTLESAGASGAVCAGAGETRLFIHPGHRFQIVDALLTNFHVPRSSLLMLVCAFAGREAVLQAYREAVAARYRFYSYGDAMLIV